YAPLNDIIGPLHNPTGYEIIKVLARESREASVEQIVTVKSTAFDTWLQNLRTAFEDNIQIFPVWQNQLPYLPAYVLPGGNPQPQPSPTAFDLHTITFTTIYNHPSGWFSVTIPSGWVTQTPITEDIGAEISAINRDVPSIIQVSMQKPDHSNFTLDD